MTNVLKALQFIYDNLPMLLAIGAVSIGIAVKIKQFMKLSKEEKEAQLKAQGEQIVELLKKQLLAVVTKAEKEWGSGTGTIKKAWVWEQLTIQYNRLMEFIESGIIDKELVDDLIEAAVDELNEQLTKNTKVAAAVGQETTVQKEGE